MRALSKCVGPHARATFQRWLLVVALLSAAFSSARAEDDTGPLEAYARVVIDSAALRTGPGALFALVRVAEQGETFLIRERATRGYWFRVELPDGQSAWIAGDAVHVQEPTSDQRPGWLRKLFGPPPLIGAHGEIAVTLGTLSGAGFMAVRPTYLLAPTFGLEANLAGAVSSSGRVLMAGGGAVVNAFPSFPIVPFFVLGGGTSYATPNADSFVLEEGGRSLLYAGGGLRFGFKKRLIVRIESRSVLFFDPNQLVAQTEISGGLTAFF